MATKAQGNDCYEKAAMDEPVFTLRGQDITADLIVKLWAMINAELRLRVAAGGFVDEVMQDLHNRCFDMFRSNRVLHPLDMDCPKLAKAWRTAMSMKAWPTRKVSD